MFKAPYQIVIEEAFPTNERLQAVARQEMTYTRNHVGGRPSDSARTAVSYVKRALDARDVSCLASPTARALMQDWLDHLDRPVAKFNPGRVVITAALHAEIRRQGMEEMVLLMPYLDRHCSGDWGETDEHDKRMNDDALKNGARIISAYDVPKIGRIWIITDGTYDEDQDAKQREVTTVMFPSDY